nr:uncharacterized protein LOC123762287 [Procambarus clarkii]
MYSSGNYPGGTAVMVVRTRRFGFIEKATPDYFRQGVQIGCMVLTFPMVVFLGMFGILLIFLGTIAVGIFRHISNLRFNSEKGFDGVQIVDIILLTSGIIIVLSCITVCIYARWKYRNYRQQVVDSPERVMSSNLHQSNSYPVQQSSCSVQQASYPVQQASYPAQQTSFPGQPTGHPAQEAFYPAQPASAFPGQPATYRGEPCQPPQARTILVSYGLMQPGELAPLATASSSNATMDYLPGPMHVPLAEEYRPPPAYAPDSSPPPYTP